MLKKTMMLAMAVAVVAAFAVPAAATASKWQHNHAELKENAQIQLTGQAKFNGGLGSVECETTSQLSAAEKSSTGEVTQFDPDLDEANSTVTGKCSAGGFLAACQVHAAVATETPWGVHNETTRVEITSGTIDLSMTGGFCPAKTAKVTPVNAASSHTVTATPDVATTTSSFTLSGQVLVHLYSSHTAGQAPFRSETATVSGTQNILGAGAGTYGTA